MLFSDEEIALDSTGTDEEIALDSPDEDVKVPQVLVRQASGIDCHCPVCYEYNTEHKRPVCLPCGHTVCAVCVSELSLCPICRGPISPRDQFPINYAYEELIFHNREVEQVPDIQELIENHHQQQQQQSKSNLQELCEECNQEMASHFCNECNMLYCKQCDEVLHKFKALKDHYRRLCSQRILAASLFCQEHHGERLKLFCMDDEVAICRDCCNETLGNHHSHMKRSLEDATQILYERTITDIQGMKQILDQSQQSILDIINNSKLLFGKAQIIAESLEENTNNLMIEVRKDAEHLISLSVRNKEVLELLEIEDIDPTDFCTRIFHAVKSYKDSFELPEMVYQHFHMWLPKALSMVEKDLVKPIKFLQYSLSFQNKDLSFEKKENNAWGKKPNIVDQRQKVHHIGEKAMKDAAVEQERRKRHLSKKARRKLKCGSWNCPVCTYHNGSSLVFCHMCGSQRNR